MMQKSYRNLAKAIGSCSWGMFGIMLQYKAEWYGKHLIKIGKYKPSSKRCNNCGEINKGLKLKDRDWECKNCGSKNDRDINAALNIKYYGLQKLGMEQAEYKRLDAH